MGATKERDVGNELTGREYVLVGPAKRVGAPNEEKPLGAPENDGAANEREPD